MSKKTYKILLIGPQGSGKGTQAKLLADRLGLEVFSTGNFFRQRKQVDDEMGRKISQYIDNGALVPDELVDQLAGEWVKEHKESGYILDGLPRTMTQALFLDKIDEFSHVLLINISDDESVKRLAGRRTCMKCQAVYHMENKPPKRDGICDLDGEKLLVRKDETSEHLQERLRQYHTRTEPLLDFYKQKGILIEIDGSKSIEEVNKQVEEKLDLVGQV